MPKLFEITDAYTPEETIDGLPVEPVLPTERPRVIINTAEFDKPKPDPLWDDVEGFKNKVKSGVSGIGDAIKYASELDQKFTSSIVNFPKKAYENSDDLIKGIKNLFGLGEEERYQLWPEKVVKEALTSAGDIAKPNPYPEGSEQWQFYEDKRQEGMVPAAMAISALAGSGGLAGTGAKAGEVALGATPFLRPALKHKEKLYKGKPGQEHQDIIPKELYEDFRQKAMSGEDLAEYNFGFINDKGHFLNREAALKYGIDTGLIDPHAGKFGALTTTLMADSSKPGTAIEAVAKTYPLAKPADRWMNTQGQNDHLMRTMSPDEFLKNSRSLKIDAESRENIDALKQHMREGKPLDPLELHKNGKEDGRHRAIAAKELGIKEVPVLDFREANPFYSMADSSKPGVAIEAMAKANPYATDVFHGTPNNALTELKATRASKKEQMGLKGVHVAEDPAFASIYAGETGNVMPLKAQLGKMLDSTKPVVEGSPEAAFLEDLLKGTGRKPMYMEGANKGDPRVAPPLHTYIDSVGPSKAEKILDKHGYDSVKYQAKYGSLGVGGKGMNVSAESPSYLIREPSNLRSKFAKFDPDDFGKNGLLLADSSKEGAALQANKPTFYSAVEHTVKNINQSKMNGEAWLGTLANKPGVKPEELDWTGLKSFLEENKGKPVTKQQIEEHLAANKVELKEVRKGQVDENSPEFKNEVESILKLRPNMMRSVAEDMAHENILNKFDGETKYQSYQLPGGENYREMLLTLPDKQQRFYEWEYFDPKTQTAKQFKTEAEAKAAAPEGAVVVPKEVAEVNPAYRSYHWDEPNILAHVRMNDRNIDGKKSLHLEEIQSDWHQAGRDKGYKQDNKNKLSVKNEGGIWRVRDEKGERVDLDGSVGFGTEELARAAIARNTRDIGGVPDAPFKKSWHELALKRMLREAAEKGYDRLSWTPGEAQAARYSLEKQLKELQYLKNDDGTYSIAGVTKDGGGFNHPENVTADKLPNIVGKEMAEKIIKNEGKRARGHPANGGYFEGVDLKIGGEGMKGFYDQIIPKALEKLGKEHGVKVKQSYVTKPETHVKFEDRGKPKDPNRLKQPVYYIDIPQSLKDTAMKKGFPLFSNAHPGFTFIPYAGNPFENSK